MSFRSIVVLLLAGVCGICAVVAILNTSGLSAGKQVDTVPVVVAAVEIHRGETIDPKMIRLVDWPKNLVPPGAILAADQAVERTALMGILKDEPLLAPKIADGSTGHGLAPLITDGMRAFTILTPSDSSGVAGFILPGNRVDVVLTVGGNDELSGGGTATTLLQNIEVLAVGQRLEAPPQNKVEAKEMRSVTLSVTPDQAAKLSLAQTKGTLQLSLRSDVDAATAAVAPVTLKELRFLQNGAQAETPVAAAAVEAPAPEPAAAAPAVAPAPVYQIRMLRGVSGGMVSVTGRQSKSRFVPTADDADVPAVESPAVETPATPTPAVKAPTTPPGDLPPAPVSAPVDTQAPPLNKSASSN